MLDGKAHYLNTKECQMLMLISKMKAENVPLGISNLEVLS